MSSSALRKLSGLSSVELLLAYNSLLKLKRAIVYEEDSEDSEGSDPNEPPPEGFEQQVDSMLSLLGSRLEGSQSLSFSSMTFSNLTELNITFAGFLVLKPNIQERVSATTSRGRKKLWSSQNLYCHLHLLEILIPRTTEASARAWIDALFFRASAMLPADKRMILNMEHTVPPTSISPSSLRTLSGFVNYTAVVASDRTAGLFLTTPNIDILRQCNTSSGFFVSEAKLDNPLEHISQVVSEMYACGKCLQKKVLRGALTNGRDWIFLIMKFNDNYDGASYVQSTKVEMTVTRPEDLHGGVVISKPWPDLIAAILSHWIENSFADLGEDDWFDLV